MELRIQGRSLDRIRMACLEEGLVPAKLVRSYHLSLIHAHLNSPFFAAIQRPHDGFKSQFIWRGTWYEAKHEPVFSADEWTQLKASFGKRTLQRKLKHEGLFSQGKLSLTCEQCSCKITYAPKTKPSGKRYKYYRCSDGKRVHRGRAEPQVNVREENILEQLGSVVDEIVLTPELAGAIACGLNETHRKAMAAKARSADGYRAEIGALAKMGDR